MKKESTNIKKTGNKILNFEEIMKIVKENEEENFRLCRKGKNICLY